MSLNFISHWGEQRENWKLLSLVRSPAMFSTKSTYRNYVNPHWTCWLEHWLNKDPMDQRFSHNPYSWSAWYTPEKLTTGTWKSPICKGKVIWTKPSWPIFKGFCLMSRDFCCLQTSIFLGVQNVRVREEICQKPYDFLVSKTKLPSKMMHLLFTYVFWEWNSITVVWL